MMPQLVMGIQASPQIIHLIISLEIILLFGTKSQSGGSAKHYSVFT